MVIGLNIIVKMLFKILYASKRINNYGINLSLLHVYLSRISKKKLLKNPFMKLFDSQNCFPKKIFGRIKNNWKMKYVLRTRIFNILFFYFSLPFNLKQLSHGVFLNILFYRTKILMPLAFCYRKYSKNRISHFQRYPR